MTFSIVDFLKVRIEEDAVALAVPASGAPWHDQWVNGNGHALRTVNDHVLAYDHPDFRPQWRSRHDADPS